MTAEDATATVDTMVTAAARAARPWGDAAPAHRAQALEAAAQALDGGVDRLVPVAVAETSLGEARLTGEVARTSGQLRMFAGLLCEGSYVDAVISPGDAAAGRPDVRRMLYPAGPVAVFAAGNFPFAFSVAGGDTASALAAGCPVVVKVHDGHPETSRLVAEIVTGALDAAGAPAGLLGLVSGLQAGRDLVQHPGIKAVGFTGSTAGGRALFDLAAGRPDPIPFYGELGSINPVLVLPQAAHDRATDIAAGYVASLTLGTGQFCTNPGLMLVPGDESLLTAIASAVQASAGGSMLTERIHDQYQHAIADSTWQRQTLLATGSATGMLPGVPEVRVATVADLAGPDGASLTCERFGPAGLVVTYASPDEALAAIPALPGSLVATIHASDADLPLAAQAADAFRLIAGRIIMNGWPTGVAVNWAMHHGGRWPASTAAAHTSVGATAIRRWLTPVAYQDWPDELLPPALQQANPLGIRQTIQP